MAASEQPLDRVGALGIVAQPVSIGPRQTERQKDEARKERRPRRTPQSIEEALEEEQLAREGEAGDSQAHIDYHA